MTGNIKTSDWLKLYHFFISLVSLWEADAQFRRGIYHGGLYAESLAYSWFNFFLGLLAVLYAVFAFLRRLGRINLYFGHIVWIDLVLWLFIRFYALLESI